MYFKRQVGMLDKDKRKQWDIYWFLFIELSTMYRTMESKNYLTAEDAITDLREG